MKTILFLLFIFIAIPVYSFQSDQQTNPKREEIVELIKQGISHWSQHQYDSAAYYLQLSETKAVLQKDTQLLIASYNNQGLLAMAQGKNQTSLKFYQKSLQLFPDSIPNKAKLQALLNIGVTYKRMGNYTRSLKYLMKTIEHAKHFPEGKELASCYNEIGTIKKNQKQYEDAIQYHLKALKVRQEIGNLKGIVASLNNVGNCYKELKKFNKALVYYEESLELKKQLGNKKYLASAYVNIGDVQLRLKEYGKAFAHLSKALQLKEKIKDRAGIAIAHTLLGELHTQLKAYPKAEQHLQQAKKLAEEIQALDLQKECYLQMKNLYVAKGDMKHAIAFYDLYLSRKDSIFSRENVQNMQRLETEFKSREKQQQIEMLEVKTENQQLSLEKTEQERNMMFAGLSLLVLLVVPVGFYARQRNKNKVLEARINSENKECTRIAKELHDSVSGSLTTIRYLLESGTEGNSLVENIESVSKEVRGISHKLNMSALAKQGIKEAVYDALMLNQFPKDIQLAINMPEGFEVKDFEVKINFIRILQELVQNTIKYAEASRVEISFEQEKKSILLTYQDNGKGCDMEQISIGNGLRNIKDRVKYIKGALEFDSQPDNGFYCSIKI